VIGKIAPFILIGYVQMTLILLAGRSTLAKTQQQAMQMSFFFLLPNILLSGFMFPFEGMPAPARFLAQALPLTHFLRIVRSITLKGGDFSDVRIELVWLGAILGVLILLASLRFRKKLI
jgi:ABC-2 type transport system permease protein